MTDKWKNICTIAAITTMASVSLGYVTRSDRDNGVKQASVVVHTSVSATETALPAVSSAISSLSQYKTTTTLSSEVVTTSTQTVEFPIDLNSATVYELSRLPGIGEVLAGNIVTYRSMIGGFTSRKQLLEVDGIGEGRLADIYGMVWIAGEMEETAPVEPIEPVDSETETEAVKPQILEINTATHEDFAAFPEVSPELGREITEFRDDIHGFSSVYELLYVDGMTVEIYCAIEKYLVCTENYTDTH